MIQEFHVVDKRSTVEHLHLCPTLVVESSQCVVVDYYELANLGVSMSPLPYSRWWMRWVKNVVKLTHNVTSIPYRVVRVV